MSKRIMPKPQVKKIERPNGLRWDVMPKAFERWAPELMAATEQEATISVLDPIGIDTWTGEGVTAKRISAALRAIGADKDVTVNVNSPGGDLFEGLAIYSLLREHKGNVTVKVLGVAASAASIVAMAGDEVQIARAGFLMIHNTWVIAMGNRNELHEIADMLEPFDSAMADIYAARSELDIKAVQKMMDAETWIGGAAAVDQGFADAFLPSDEVKKDAKAKTQDRAAAHSIDVALAKAGMPRSERRALLHEFKAGTLSAAGVSTPSAVDSGTLNAADASLVSEVLISVKNYQPPEILK
jgi:ATP-dependent Clp protease protease subunit